MKKSLLLTLSAEYFNQAKKNVRSAVDAQVDVFPHSLQKAIWSAFAPQGTLTSFQYWTKVDKLTFEQCGD